ncbi:hypothetical protein D9M72_398290 [compost metagenome]
MHNNDLKALLATTLSIAALGASVLACGPAAAHGLNDRGADADRYGYNLQHNGKRDPFTEGAHVNGKRDAFTDGAHVNGKRDAFTDGAHVNGKRDAFTDGANQPEAGMDLAGMDRTGVSAPPAHAA